MLTIQVTFIETDSLEYCIKKAKEFARRNDCCVEFEKDGVKNSILPHTLEEFKQQEFFAKQQKAILDNAEEYHHKIMERIRYGNINI